MSYTFMGYPRANGKYGARNLVAVIPSVICANDVGQAICRQVQGTIAFAPMGEGGFGYDPVFFYPPLAKTFGQLTAEEKSAISHRGKALAAFSEKLATYLRK